jgi:hypothetical protein
VAVDPAGGSISRAGQWSACRDPRAPAAASYDENLMTGVSYRNGGGKWRGPRPPTGYRVQYSDHWVFAGTGLVDGDVFGAEERLVGYECDGAPIDDPGDAGCGRAAPVRPNGRDRTPPGFTILGVGDLRGWDVADGSGELSPQAAATMGVYVAGGTVFTAATVDWPRVLLIDPTVARITQNVIVHALQGP